MDLLQEIKKKIPALEGHESIEGIKAVIRHIEVAERYLIRARDEREEDFFNDVIYRTNQAFEGMLKEAYTVLTSNEGTKLSPHQIEQHLLQEKVLASRVLELLKNYRQQWRNPSTHDHKLFFGDQEALLAIVSISAFANILLDQIIEAINYKREQEDVLQKQEAQEFYLKYINAPFHKQVQTLLLLFDIDLKKTVPDPRQLREVEIVGRLNGFISIDPDITVEREPPISGSGSSYYRPDFILRKNDQAVIVEVKKAGFSKSMFESGLYQLQIYLDAAQLEHGVLYIPSVGNIERDVGVSEVDLGGRKLFIHYVVPKQMNS